MMYGNEQIDSFTHFERLYREAKSPLTDVRKIYITSTEDRLLLDQLRDSVYERQTVLYTCIKLVRSLSEYSHKLAFDSVFSQVANHLRNLSESEVRDSSSKASQTLCHTLGVKFVCH